MEWMWDSEDLPAEDVDVKLVAAGLSELIAGHDDETALMLIMNVLALAWEWRDYAEMIRN
jgi:hypothetical protein